MGIILFPYSILIQFRNNSKSINKLKETINSINIGEFDVEKFIEIIHQESGEKAYRNPILWLLKSPFLLSLISTLTFIGTTLLIIIISSTLNAAFPNIFFNGFTAGQNQLHVWFNYIFDQLLIIIPIDLIGPFFPNRTDAFVLQPWGGIISILFQMLLAFTAYQYIITVILSAKLSVNKNEIMKAKKYK